MSSTRIEDLEAQVASLERRLKSWVDSRGKVWAVVYMDYQPPEVDSLWNNEKSARAHASNLRGDYNVVEMIVSEGEP